MNPFPAGDVFMMQSLPPPKLVTVGVIAAEVGVSVERVCRILRSRLHIKPSAYAGNVRLFANEAITQVRQELNKINDRRCPRQCEGERL